MRSSHSAELKYLACGREICGARLHARLVAGNAGQVRVSKARRYHQVTSLDPAEPNSSEFARSGSDSSRNADFPFLIRRGRRTGRRHPRYPQSDALRRNGARGSYPRVHRHRSSGEELGEIDQNSVALFRSDTDHAYAVLNRDGGAELFRKCLKSLKHPARHLR